MLASPDLSRSSLGEEAVVFDCSQSRLVGILHHAESRPKLGVLIVTGGPQYRIGSHRQFLLLARAFAAAGFPTLRFDHRGSGDSDGQFLGFEHIGADIGAAVDALFERCPDLEGVVLWGLCDAASAILFYAQGDSRVAGLLLLNPWVRSAESESRAMVKHYYASRFLDRDFWRRLFSGEVVLGAAFAGFFSSLIGWLWPKETERPNSAAETAPALPERMANGFAGFKGPVGLVMSGRDLTAQEFEDVARKPPWHRHLAEDRVTRLDLETADHTFSRRVWRENVITWSLSWLHRLQTTVYSNKL